MLKQIIAEMYVDPELLEQLSEEQKENLFGKMREEQLRRWRAKQEELERKERDRPYKRTRRKINFILGSDGEPWVWVMGEHLNDLSYEELVKRREREEAEREKMAELQDRKEAEELAKQETRDILSLARKFGDVRVPSPTVRTRTDGARRMSPVPERKENDQFLKPPLRSLARTESQTEVQESPMPGRKADPNKEEDLRKKTLVRKASIIGMSVEEQQKFEKKRADEIFETVRRAKFVAKKRAADITKEVEEGWKQSEEKAKTFDRQRRQSIQKAKRSPPNLTPEKILEQLPSEKKAEFVRRLSERSSKKPARPAPPRPLVKQASIILPNTQPKSPSHIKAWFRNDEGPRGVGREKDGSISIWFHGLTDREMAEKLLESKPVGSFLVRLSTKIWGYTVSVKGYTECKHFLVDASSGKYHFVGPKQQKFKTLPELFRFYRVNPITYSGQEVLLLPVGQEVVNMEVFRGLFHDDEGETSYL